MKANEVRPRTVTLIGKLIRPWIDEGIISVPEGREIIANLKHLAQRGTLIPAVPPRLLNQEETAAMLGISKSNLKKLESQGTFPIRRKMVGGTSVRYRSTDIIQFILSDEEEAEDNN
jgi:predicted DNA-binding transcriptional regulator AlpA